MSKLDFKTMDKRDRTNIVGFLNNYKIIEKKESESKIEIIGYDTKILKDIEKNDLKIGIVPFSNQEWFDIKYLESKYPEMNYFEIIEKNNLNEIINRKICDILERLSRKEITIVVFPELAMNTDTENYVSKWLALQSFLDKNFKLELVCLGSKWLKGKNECLMLSGAGTSLIRNSKKHPFSIKKNQIEYLEKLEERPEKYQLLDIQNVGRIAYLICKDGLSDLEQISLWNEHGVSFEIISSFSNSISFFKNQAKSYSEKYKGISILANCCQPRIKNNKESIGFLSAPAIQNKEPYLTEGIVREFKSDSFCNKQCSFCKCTYIYSIKPKEISENNTHRGICIELEKEIY